LSCNAAGEIVLRNTAQRMMIGLGPTEEPTREELSRRIRYTDDDGQEISLIDSPLIQALRGIERAGVALTAPLRISELRRCVLEKSGPLGRAARRPNTDRRDMPAALRDSSPL